MASKKRDHLVAVAADLFHRHGYHAVGIDRVLEEAGVARMTLYNHFKSKDELIQAALELKDRQIREWLVAAVERRARKPADRLLAIFDAFDERIRTGDFRGCPLMKATGEFPDPSGPVAAVARHHREMMQSYMRGLASDAGARDPAALARQLYLLLEGAIVSAQMTGDLEVAKDARIAAQRLVDGSRAS